MYRIRVILASAFASVAAGSAVFHESTTLCLAPQSASPAPPPPPSDLDASPLFRRPPSPPSITLPASIPPRSRPSLHPLLVVVIVRHGARTPVNFLDGQSKAAFQRVWGRCHAIDSRAKRDREALEEAGRESEAQPLEVPLPENAPSDDRVLVPCGRGQLTPQGEQQMFSIGQALRLQYVEKDGFLPPTLTSPALLYLRATNTSRTRLSTVRLVQGLYPSLPLSLVRNLTAVRPEQDEDLYPSYRYCDRLREIFHSTLQHPLYKRFLDTPSLTSFHRQALSLLSSTPFEPKPKTQPHRSWIAMSDEIKCRQAAGLPLPNGMTTEMAERIDRCAEFLFHSLLKGGEHSTEQRVAEESRLLNDRSSVYNESLRLGIGRFISSLLPVFLAALSRDPSTPRLMVFGGHDSTIVPTLSSLGLDWCMDGQWPPFGSYIVMELLQDGNGRGKDANSWVRVVYNGKEVEMMPVNEFERRVEMVGVEDYSRQCRPKGKGTIPPQVW